MICREQIMTTRVSASAPLRGEAQEGRAMICREQIMTTRVSASAPAGAGARPRRPEQ